jgi:hypothetical protein
VRDKVPHARYGYRMLNTRQPRGQASPRGRSRRTMRPSFWDYFPAALGLFKILNT